MLASKLLGVKLRLTHVALATMLTHAKYPTLASTSLTESHTVLHWVYAYEFLTLPKKRPQRYPLRPY
jgi:hypothetical protein